MKCAEKIMQLYAVTDRALLNGRTLYEQVKEALEGGVTCVQLREKSMTESAFLAEALEIKALCREYSIPLIINDNVEVAIRSGADGVHVGQHDMPVCEVRARIGDSMLLGVSAQTVEQALQAERDGADYIGTGAMFPTSTKPDADSVSCDTLRAICHAVSVPVVAIGGINKTNIQKLSGTGVHGVALVSAIFAADDITSECRELKALSEKMTGSNSAVSATKAACHMKTALSIAGSDCSGGAGIQADIKTMTMNGVFAMSAITALTAQNTTGVSAIMEVTPDFLEKQIDMIFTDIRPDAVKIGMAASSRLIDVIADRLLFYQAQNIVVDPVMVSTSGTDLMADEAVAAMQAKLLPIATVVTPNIPEAEVLSGIRIKNEADMLRAAERIHASHNCAVLLKGGHCINDANDLLYSNEQIRWFYGRRINNPNTHGTGCTLSSAIAANLAKGFSLTDSIQRAKDYISGALGYMLRLGSGSGPMNHAFDLSGEFAQKPESGL